MSLPIKVTLVLLLYIVSFLSVTDSARILGLFPTHSKSHLIIHSALAEALAERGHDFTFVTTFPPISNKKLPYRYLYLDVSPISSKIFSEAIQKPRLYKSIINFIDASAKLSNESFHHPLMQKLMNEESFDLVLQGYFLNDFLFGVAAHFKCPLVLTITTPPFTNVNDFVGNPQEFAYVPVPVVKAKQPLGFFDRVRLFIILETIGELLFKPYLRFVQELLYRANFPSDKYPSLSTMMKNISLVLSAHHFSQTPIRPNVPAMVDIGGIQIKEKPDPLPEDIKSVLDNSNSSGVIYFSLGTNVHQNNLNSSKIKLIFDVLSKLPEKTLCKWSDQDVPLNSPNIFYRKWLPQNEVLRHQNVKLFITHGGLGSITEAQYHGVPMVGIPLFNDQYTNMQNVQDSGHGLILDYETLTENTARQTIVEVLRNQKYTDNVKRFSRVYRDRPLSAKQSAVYWVEYVMRHHGAQHMQSPAIHMNRFQLLSLDVIGFLLLVFYIIFMFLKVVFRKVSGILRGNKVKRE